MMSKVRHSSQYKFHQMERQEKIEWGSVSPLDRELYELIEK